MQLADETPLHGFELFAELARCIQQPQGRFIDFAALLGEPEAGAAALAKPHAETAFELAHLQAERGLAEVELKLGGRESAGFDHRLEHLEEPEIRVVDAAFHGSPRPS